MSMGKGLLDSNGGRCSGKGGEVVPWREVVGGWLAKRSIKSNDGHGGGGLVIRGEERIVSTVVMVLVEEKSMVEEFSWECLRIFLVRFPMM
ncbi:hypothetical protein Tco_0611195 [Tanacetum coccineum]